MMRIVLAVALLAAGLALPAQARSRDDAMIGAYRCAGIGVSRSWLDCYYAAAQPVRAALGLPPAPAAQLRLLENPPTGPAQDQQTRDAVISQASACAGSDRAWLDCYYGAALPMRVVLKLAPPPALEPVRVNRPAPPPGDNWFTGSHRALVSRMTAYSFDRGGVFTVTLANGQVWRQLPGDVRHPDWKKPAAAYVAGISHGALGSTNLEVQGSPGLFRVEQVR